MKKLENKQTEVKVADNKNGTYADLIKLILDVPPQGGFKISEMKQRFRISDIVETSKSGTIELEDADADYVKKLVSDMMWPVKHKDLIAFVEDVGSCF